MIPYLTIYYSPNSVSFPSYVTFIQIFQYLRAYLALVVTKVASPRLGRRMTRPASSRIARCFKCHMSLRSSSITPSPPLSSSITFHEPILTHLMLVISPIHDARIIGSSGGIHRVRVGQWCWSYWSERRWVVGDGACQVLGIVLASL